MPSWYVSGKLLLHRPCLVDYAGNYFQIWMLFRSEIRAPRGEEKDFRTEIELEKIRVSLWIDGFWNRRRANANEWMNRYHVSCTCIKKENVPNVPDKARSTDHAEMIETIAQRHLKKNVGKVKVGRCGCTKELLRVLRRRSFFVYF